MPGKKESEAAYSFMSAVKKYRTVAAADTATQAAIEAISEVIDMGAAADGYGISIGRGNTLIVGALFPAAVTGSTVQVFVNMGGALDVDNSWALVQSEDLTVSGHIVVNPIYPGPVKILVTDITGSGSVELVYSRSE